MSIALLCILLYISKMNKSFVLRWQSQVKKGTLTFIVLNILDKKGELYGYELIENVKDKTSIIIAEGTLYPLLMKINKNL